MSKDWTKTAEALGIPLPLNTAALDSLEAVFRPLVSTIPLETEPAFTLPDR